jgi:hypothetical protein
MKNVLLMQQGSSSSREMLQNSTSPDPDILGSSDFALCQKKKK